MSMNPEALHSILVQHVPATAVPYCFELWSRYHFNFRLRKSRVSKIGDFSIHPGNFLQITVNRDLHPCLFLITYIHEVAHLAVHLQACRNAGAHGQEWKKEFQRLLSPVMNEENFPAEVLTSLRKHMINPKATTYADATLMRALRACDERAAMITLLSDIGPGSIFELQGRWFKKGETKRTRVLCQEVKTKKKYLVPADAAVRNVQLSLL
jgi:SprT protein